MKKGSTIFLQAVIVLIGIGTLAFLLWEPLIEGRNIDSTPLEVYFKDPFLAYAYASSILFFVGLYQAFMLLGYIGQNKVFSLHSVKALRTIKYCALATAGLIVAGVAYIIIANSGKDDIVGGVAMGAVTTFVSIVIATAAAVFEGLLQNAVDMKSKNDLMV